MALLTLQAMQHEFLSRIKMDRHFNMIQIMIGTSGDAPKVLIELFLVA